MNQEQVRQLIREELADILLTDRIVFPKKIQILDARNIQLGKTTGTKIGTETTQKIAFYGVTPVVQAGAIGSPSGGGTQDAQARTAIDSIRTALTNMGITQ